MKRIVVILTCLCLFALTYAQTDSTNVKRKRVQNQTNAFVNRDDMQGGPINVGFSIAPTVDWMFPYNKTYIANGPAAGVRAGINLNVNLTKSKKFYFSTGLFFERIGGKMIFHDQVPVPNVGIADTTETHRTYSGQYLTVPFGITIKSRPIRNFYICGDAGIYNSLLLKSFNKDSYLLGDELWSREKKASTETAILKEAGFIGLGFEYSIRPKTRCGFYVNYVNTFTNYFKNKGLAPNNLTGENQKAKFGYLEFVLNINFF